MHYTIVGLQNKIKVEATKINGTQLNAQIKLTTNYLSTLWTRNLGLEKT